MESIAHIHDLPLLAKESVHIWGVHVPQISDQIDALYELLSTPEQKKAQRFHRKADRDLSIAARGALRVLLGGYTKRSPAALTFSLSENGKPHLANSHLAFNVSHSGEWAVIAMGRERSIGVDIEQIKPTKRISAVAKRFFTEEEQTALQEADDPAALFYPIWVRKEAYVKACGSTLFSELGRISVPLAEGAEQNGHFFYPLKAGSKYAAAVVSNRPIKALPCYNFSTLTWKTDLPGQVFPNRTPMRD